MKPVLLLIPGMLNDARVWAEVVPALQAQAEVRVADVLRQSSIAEMRHDAWALLQDVPDTVPVVVAGFSMGGYVALDMIAHPARPLAALALLSTSALPDSPEGLANREKTLAAMQGNFAKFVDGVLQWSTHSATPEQIQDLRQMMLAIGSETAQRQVRAIMGRSDHRALLQTLQLPVQVLCGQQDRITPPALSQALAQTCPKAQLQLVANAGHMLPCEQAAAVIDALQASLKSIH